MSTDDPVLIVRLRRGVWELLLDALSSRPYGEVSEMIEEIRRQGGSQLVSENTPTESAASARVN
ncbi:MAG: hypothetical protein WBE91_11760 [Steroidobacteraceae bacterium]